MYIKVSNKPWQSLVKQGFGRSTDAWGDVLVKDGLKYHMPRSVDRALRNESNGRKVKPFQFLLQQIVDSPKVSVKTKVPLKKMQEKVSKNIDSWWATNGPQITKLMPEKKIEPKVKYVLTDKVVTFYFNGQSHSTSKANPVFDKVVELLKTGDLSRATELCNIAKAIDVGSEGMIKADNGVLKHNDKELEESVSEWLLRNLGRKDGAIQAVINFMKKCNRNPSPGSIDMLWRFIRKNGLILFPDGDILCYRYCTDDFKDQHTQTFDNSVGQICEMKREDVTYDPKSHCASGLHAQCYSGVQGCSTAIEIKVSPEDVVSVPENEDWKMRVCKFMSWKVLRHKGVQVAEKTGEFVSL